MKTPRDTLTVNRQELVAGDSDFSQGYRRVVHAGVSTIWESRRSIEEQKISAAYLPKLLST